MAAITDAELEHDVIALVRPEVGHALESVHLEIKYQIQVEIIRLSIKL